MSTIEEYIVDELKRLREENEALKAEKSDAVATNGRDTVIDLHSKIVAYEVSPLGKYDLFNSSNAALKNATLDQLRTVADSSDTAIMNYKVGDRPLVRVNERVFPISFKLDYIKKVKTFGADPFDRYAMSVFTEIVEKPETGEYITKPYVEHAKIIAAHYVRECIQERIDELEREASEE